MRSRPPGSRISLASAPLLLRNQWMHAHQFDSASQLQFLPQTHSLRDVSSRHGDLPGLHPALRLVLKAQQGAPFWMDAPVLSAKMAPRPISAARSFLTGSRRPAQFERNTLLMTLLLLSLSVRAI